ncbi:transient receptor potential cation channel subfamily A member 1-like [Orbicella faveolata]|uniref:transient receptor potential cation channel subfamily A member 1-like n=1 Tax=Orbicella faveolata TaxID=48498 RepID=UPI0009E1C489|nr:transient receptor potential cation channel subfamily A member 1-like [Orbicella faveolata]
MMLIIETILPLKLFNNSTMHYLKFCHCSFCVFGLLRVFLFFFFLLLSHFVKYRQKTIVAVLDCLISPRWPHPPCLPSDIVPCLSWEQLQDTPTHFQVTYDILESDVNGRFPDDAEYEYTPKSCYYNLAKHCQQTLNKEILNHVVIKLLTERKWNKYASFWFRVRGLNYLIFLAVLCTDFMLAATSVRPVDHQTPSSFTFLEGWAIAMTLWFLLDELSELQREPLAYIKDVFNYLDLSGYSLILVTYVIRFFGNGAEWTFASLAIFINFIGIFKYAGFDRNIGLYIKCLGKVVYKDIPRFLVVFWVILMTFSVSFYMAMRAENGTVTGRVLNNNTLRNEISCTTSVGCVILAGVMTWLEGSSIVRNLSEVGWLGALLTVVFMMSVTIILLNILIAQLSLTYELVQEESLNSFIALRMQAVATIEWQSRFKFWVGIHDAIKSYKGKNVTKVRKISCVRSQLSLGTNSSVLSKIIRILLTSCSKRFCS